MLEIISLYSTVAFLFTALVFHGRKEGWRERERQVFQDMAASADEYRKCQRKWHRAGFWERFFIALAIIVAFMPNWYLMLLMASVALWFGWVLYDGLTNMPKDLSGVSGTSRWYQKFFYSGSKITGTGSEIDIAMGQYLPFIKFIYTLLVPVFIVMYLYLEIWTR